MIRKLLLPAMAVVLLAGCATGYGYRAGNGDYYYGQPSIDYQDGGYYPYGGAGYGYPGGWSGMIGYGMGYGGGYGPYGYSPYGYGGYPYGYGYPYYPPIVVVRPDPAPGGVRHLGGHGDQPLPPPTSGVPPVTGHRWLQPSSASMGNVRRPLELPPPASTWTRPERIQIESTRSIPRDVPQDIPRDRDDGLRRHH
ncbi:MAG: hypothetical protein JWL98_1312 [Xanthomonadaceae bacterium]|nr:hypothetical protein [Xanthomonadaceae bacterium]